MSNPAAEKNLHFAITQFNVLNGGGIDRIKQAFSDGACPNAEVFNYPLLLSAINSKQESIIREFMNHPDTDYEVKDRIYLRTPLHKAAELGNLGLVQSLIDRKVSLNVRDSQGKTALHTAAVRHWDIVSQLIKAGADIHLRDNSNHSILTFAAFQDFFENVEVLTSLGVTVTDEDVKACQTPKMQNYMETILRNQRMLAEVAAIPLSVTDRVRLSL